MKKLMVLLLILTIFIVGCGNNNTDEEQSSPPNGGADTEEDSINEETEIGYLFEYNGVAIPMHVNATPIVETLGDPIETFEAPSCAFQGLDKVFYYSGFELNTYPDEGEDFVSAVHILDDSITTTEGISIGSEVEEVVQVYGNDYMEENGFYTYSLGRTNLQFIVEDGVVTDISYLAVIDGMQ